MIGHSSAFKEKTFSLLNAYRVCLPLHEPRSMDKRQRAAKEGGVEVHHLGKN
jgi:hypothetical protein